MSQRQVIVIPMAGAGSRFAQAGYQMPKPFIPIKGRAMVVWAMENMTRPGAMYYLVCRASHLGYLMETGIVDRGDTAVVPLASPTGGCAETVLRVAGLIEDPSSSVTVVNCDQWVDYDGGRWQEITVGAGVSLAAVTMTFASNRPQHSYVRCDADGQVIEAAEKRLISNRANVGVYWFQSGEALVRLLRQMIRKNIGHGGEFYLAPVLNEFIAEGLRVQEFPVDAFHGLGTPEELATNYDLVGRHE